MLGGASSICWGGRKYRTFTAIGARMMSRILTSSNAPDSLTTPIEIGADEAGDYDSLFSLRHRAVALFEDSVGQFYFTSWANYSTPRGEYKVCDLQTGSAV